MAVIISGQIDKIQVVEKNEQSCLVLSIMAPIQNNKIIMDIADLFKQTVNIRFDAIQGDLFSGTGGSDQSGGTLPYEKED